MEIMVFKTNKREIKNRITLESQYITGETVNE
jgi:hypothetical protein